MRTLITLGALILLMALVGWITFGNEPGRSSIHLETDEIRQDTEEAIDRTGDAIKGGARMLEESLEDDDGEVDRSMDRDSDAELEPAGEITVDSERQQR